MNRTRIVFILFVSLALLAVGASVLVQRLGNPLPQPASTAIEVRLVVALPIEPWVSQAAEQFNTEKHDLEGHSIHVSITPMDGLTAMGRWERGEMDPPPTAWIPDSRYLVELVNAALKEKQGRDVFLTDGKYRARPVVISLFSWGIYQSRSEVLRASMGRSTGVRSMTRLRPKADGVS